MGLLAVGPSHSISASETRLSGGNSSGRSGSAASFILVSAKQEYISENMQETHTQVHTNTHIPHCQSVEPPSAHRPESSRDQNQTESKLLTVREIEGASRVKSWTGSG